MTTRMELTGAEAAALKVLKIGSVRCQAGTSQCALCESLVKRRLAVMRDVSMEGRLTFHIHMNGRKALANYEKKRMKREIKQ